MAISRVSNSSVLSNTPKKRSMLASNDPIYAGSFDSIASAIVDVNGSATISFSSIPQTYTHLQMRVTGLMSQTDTAISIQFNGDTTANYSKHIVSGDGVSATGYTFGSGSLSSIFVGTNAVTYTNATTWIIDILDYKDTNKYKTTRGLFGADKNATGGYIGLHSGNWRSTSAITSISMFPGAGTFNQYTHAALYGIK